jgi:hypothetical protein
MIRRLVAEVQLYDPAIRIGGGLRYHTPETSFVHGLTTGTGYQDTAGVKQF